MRTPRKPLADPPIVTTRLPAICPACASKDVARIDNFGIWKLTCQACAWSAKYQVKQ
jgi:ribosomal protein L37AE/L43A